MTEQKRASLIPVGLSKKEKKSKTDELTTRLNLTITPNNGEEFASFNYQALISKAKVRKEGKLNGVAPLDPFADDDDDQLKSIARNLEAKYGTPEKKKYGCFVNYNELGEGYDENDSFIDNSEAFDEVVPDNQTTAHGGFYINVGPLEMKTVPGAANDEQSDSDGNLGGARKGTKRPLDSESEEDSEEDDDDEDDSTSTSSMVDNAGQTNASDSDDSIEEESEDRKTANGEANGQVNKKAKVQNENKEALQGPPLKKKKNKTSGMEKKVLDSEMPTLKREDQESSTGGESRRPSTNSDAVESAGGDDRQNDDSGSSASKSISGSADTSDTDESGEGSDSPKQENTPLPPENPNLPDDIRDLIRLIHSNVNDNPAAKGKVFTPEVNKNLLRFEMRCQDLPSPLHDEAYNQLSVIMSCSPKKLARKASEILKSHIETSISTKIQGLKIAVDNQMPACLDRYNGECERLASTERNQDDKAKKPRRRFRWTPEMRGMVCELMKLKRTLYNLQPVDGLSEDDDVRSFLTQHVCPLWPAGWMKVVALMDIRPAQNSDTPAANAAVAAASKPKKTLPVQRRSLPKVANVPQSPQNPVVVPSSIQQLSVPVSSPVRTEHPAVNVMKKPSPPKASTPANLPSSIGKISVPQGTDITPVNLSSSKQNSVNGSNRMAQITVKPVFSSQYHVARENPGQSGLKQSKVQPQVSNDAVSGRTLHIKTSDLLQDVEKVPVSERDAVPSSSDTSLSVERLRASPQISKVGMSSPDKHLSNWKNRTSESQSSPQWKVKEEPSAVHDTHSALEDEILILEDFSSPSSNHKKPKVIEVTSLRSKPGGGEQTSQAGDSISADRPLISNPQTVTNGIQGREEMTITTNPIDSQDQQGSSKTEERLRNSFGEQSRQDYRMNVMNVHNLLNSFPDMLEVPQQTSVPQLKAGGGSSSSERLQAPVGGQMQIGDSRLGESTRGDRGDAWETSSQSRGKNRETPPRKPTPQHLPRSSAESPGLSPKERRPITARTPEYGQLDMSVSRASDSRQSVQSAPTAQTGRNPENRPPYRPEGKSQSNWMPFNPEVDLRQIDSRQVDLRLVEPRQNVNRPSDGRQHDSRAQQSDSRTQQPDSRIQQHESRTQQHDSRSQQHESRTQQPESRTQQHDSRTQQHESRTQQHESRSQQHDSRTQQHDSRTQQHDSRTQQHDSRTQQHDSRTQLHDSRTQQHESRSQQHESRTQQHDSRTQQHDSRTQQHDSRTQQHDSRTQQHESRTQQHDFRMQQADSRSQQHDSRAQPSDSRMQLHDSRIPQQHDSRTQQSDSRIQHHDSRTQQPDARMQHHDSRTQPPEARMQLHDSRIQSTDVRMLQPKKEWKQDRQSDVRPSTNLVVDQRKSEPRLHDQRQTDKRQLSQISQMSHKQDVQVLDHRQSDGRYPEQRQAEQDSRQFDARQRDSWQTPTWRNETLQTATPTISMDPWSDIEKLLLSSPPPPSPDARVRQEKEEEEAKRLRELKARKKEAKARKKEARLQADGQLPEPWSGDSRMHDSRLGQVRKDLNRHPGPVVPTDYRQNDLRSMPNLVEQLQAETSFNKQRPIEPSHSDVRFGEQRQLQKEAWQGSSNREPWYGEQQQPQQPQVRSETSQVDPSRSDSNQVNNWQTESQWVDPKRGDSVWHDSFYNSLDAFALDGDSPEFGVL